MSVVQPSLPDHARKFCLASWYHKNKYVRKNILQPTLVGKLRYISQTSCFMNVVILFFFYLHKTCGSVSATLRILQSRIIFRLVVPDVYRTCNHKLDRNSQLTCFYCSVRVGCSKIRRLNRDVKIRYNLVNESSVSNGTAD